MEKHMKRSILLLAGLLLVSLLLAACSAQSDSASIGQTVKTGKGQYTDVSVSELQGMLQNKDFAFINVHIPFEGKINPTDAFIPYNEIDRHLDQLPADKDAKIVLYCRSDNMSNDAARTLVDLGYTNVYNLDGGFNAWKQVGLPFDMNQ
jgi:rhodanese-related sulfurtransferase